MIWWQNRILTNVKFMLGESCTNVVSRRNNIQANFPACVVRIISNDATSHDLDISDEEPAVVCGVEVEIYSHTSLDNAFTLMGTANTAMYNMGFHRVQGPYHVEDTTAPEYYRVTSRFERVIGNDDDIPKFT